jgi:hypothetical protein
MSTRNRSSHSPDQLSLDFVAVPEREVSDLLGQSGVRADQVQASDEYVDTSESVEKPRQAEVAEEQRGGSYEASRPLTRDQARALGGQGVGGARLSAREADRQANIEQGIGTNKLPLTTEEQILADEARQKAMQGLERQRIAKLHIAGIDGAIDHSGARIKAMLDQKR